MVKVTYHPTIYGHTNTHIHPKNASPPYLPTYLLHTSSKKFITSLPTHLFITHFIQKIHHLLTYLPIYLSTYVFYFILFFLHFVVMQLFFFLPMFFPKPKYFKIFLPLRPILSKIFLTLSSNQNMFKFMWLRVLH